MPSDLPANNPSRLIEELKRQLDTPRVYEILAREGHSQVDITFRVSRRATVRGPRFTITEIA